MRAILDRVSPAATLVEALEPLRSDPDRGFLASERTDLITRTEVIVGTDGPTYGD